MGAPGDEKNCAPTRMPAARLATVKMLPNTCEDGASADAAIRASFTTLPAVKALHHRCCRPGCRSGSSRLHRR